MRNKFNSMHFVGNNFCKPGFLDKKDCLRRTTNPADVTCSDCIAWMPKYLKEYRKQVLKQREERKEKLRMKKVKK